ncbi:four helix bundle protein [Poritiphilus flavus]|uniref:Four helix bundle protein n=1 Tax=Poritiphilus flavus TaxID=2697053 RepID=A0A6L9EAK8_9FLAO|nr:four helix bundle protein [Poritiphilus flavus]NAS11581.1 four helix bundle protein [Poritiphilus flavus]
MYKYYFEKLDVWKLSLKACLEIYGLTKSFPDTEKFGLISQLRRSILSVSTNLAEGLSRASYKDQARFTSISYGSLMESLNLIIVAYHLGYIEEQSYSDLRSKINVISNKLNAFRKTQIKRIPE